MKKALPDLDKNHPFYSIEADKIWQKRIRQLIKEEEALIQENRRRYKKGKKYGDKEIPETTQSDEPFTYSGDRV